MKRKQLWEYSADEHAELNAFIEANRDAAIAWVGEKQDIRKRRWTAFTIAAIGGVIGSLIVLFIGGVM